MVDVRQLIDEIVKTRDNIADPEGRIDTWSVQHLPEEAIFISYAWSDESIKIADQVDHAFNSRGVKIIRDKREIGFKDRIKDYMTQLGQGKCVIVIISEKYLKSQSCMFELLEIVKRPGFADRVFPVVLDDAGIYDPIDRIRYIQYWETKIEDLESALKTVSAGNLQGFREDIDLYTEIRQLFSKVTDILRDMNSLTIRIHEETGFNVLFSAIQQKLSG